MSLLLDRAGLKAQLNKVNVKDDTELDVFVDAAVVMVENMIGPVDLKTGVVVTLEGTAGAMAAGPWLLDVFPVSSVQTLLSAGVSVDPAVLSIEPGGVVTASRPLQGPVRMTCTVGRDPADVNGAMKLATRVIGAHLWSTQRGPGGPSTDDEEGLVIGGGYAVPYMAADLLRPYMLPAAVA